MKNGIRISSKPTATTSLRGSYDLPAEEIRQHRDEIADIERAQERCKGCTGEVCKQPSQGMIPVVEVHDGRFCYALRRCRHERNRLARLRISRLFASARVPRAYEGDTFTDYIVTAENKDAVDAAHMMVADEIKGLFLHGEKGTGKTKLTAIIANERAGAGKPVLFASVPDLMADIRASFASGGTSERVQAVKETPFLVLDDLGAEKMTEWVGEQLFCIVNHRYNEQLPTVVTSNYSPTQIIRHMATVDARGNVIDDMQGQRIMSRIYGMCERVEIKGADWRMKGAC
ncbi:ATP-binding protein [Selenomonas flueggei]|uniref:ATP-binding protein n=1 Tax=Selenomonas flueggei TaxID=135080 RepID=UPI0026737645|nr:ATP-binding protein [Selenomonas flueggei]